MKSKILVLAVLVMSVLVFLSNEGPAQASVEPVLVADNVFNAINSGDLENAVSFFAEDATAENNVRSETYQGTQEIRQMLQEMHRENRRFEIVELKMDGDLVTMTVEISDRGLVWGSQTIESIVKDGSVQTFNVKNIRLDLWGIHRNRGN